MPRQQRRDLGVDRLAVEAEQVALVVCAQALADRLGGRRRLVAVADVDLDLAAAQAGRDLDLLERDPVGLDLAQALGDFGLGDAEHPQRVAAQRRRPCDHLAHRLGCECGRPHRLQLARGARQDDDDGPSAGTTRPGAVPTGSSGVAPSGTSACLRFDSRIASSSKLKRRANPRRISAIFSSTSSSRKQLATGEAGDDLGGEVVGGRAEPARGDDQIHPLGGHEAERRFEVVGTVADDQDVGDVDSELGEALGDPRPVGVGDRTGQHLGAGHDDSRSNLPAAPLTRIQAFRLPAVLSDGRLRRPRSRSGSRIRAGERACR